MFRWLRKLFGIALVLWIIACILNIKIADRPARDWTLALWYQPRVQKSYHFLKDRFTALIRKDISVEQIFDTKTSPSSESHPDKFPPPRPIDLEKMDPKDQKKIQEILEKYQK